MNDKPRLPFIICFLVLMANIPLGCGQPTTVKPLISKLNDPGDTEATVSLGSEADVKLGDVFDVYRENRPLGKLTITEVERDQSTATFKEIHGVQKLETGDVIIRDVTLPFLRSLRPDSVIATPAKLGREFAETDRGSGIIRILYYGLPWSDGKPLIDDETGYPVTIIGGCIVTKDFTILVNEYNLAMREHFRTTK